MTPKRSRFLDRYCDCCCPIGHSGRIGRERSGKSFISPDQRRNQVEWSEWPGSGGARQNGYPGNLCRQPARLIHGPGLCACPGPFLANGFLAPYWFRASIGDVWQRPARYGFLPAHPGVETNRRAGICRPRPRIQKHPFRLYGWSQAYLQDRSGTQLSLEYGILGLLTPSYKPEPWTPIHSLTWAKAMAWDLRGNMGEEIERAILLKTLTPDQVNDLPALSFRSSDRCAKNRDFSTAPLKAARLARLSNLAAQLLFFPPQICVMFLAYWLRSMGVLGEAGASVGSNNWVVSGKLTASGKPLLANDPHLSIEMPSIWYQIADCTAALKSDACPCRGGWFFLRGRPRRNIGHNDRIAWAFTVLPGRTSWICMLRKINPANPNQYEYMGKWLDGWMSTPKPSRLTGTAR